VKFEEAFNSQGLVLSQAFLRLRCDEESFKSLNQHSSFPFQDKLSAKFLSYFELFDTSIEVRDSEPLGKASFNFKF